jgi:hypothetical protein
MIKTRGLFPLVLISQILLVVSAEQNRIDPANESDQKFSEEPSIWETPPIEINEANIQILDKISGKVYRESIELYCPKIFGSIELKLTKCFKNSPEDNKEITALIEIRENGKVIFNNWLFASAPSVNLFSHPLYDVRIEF